MCWRGTASHTKCSFDEAQQSIVYCLCRFLLVLNCLIISVLSNIEDSTAENDVNFWPTFLFYNVRVTIYSNE